MFAFCNVGTAISLTRALQIGSSILADGVHCISQPGNANEAAIIDNFPDVDNRSC